MIELNRGLQDQIAAGIRAGGFDHIAAQAFGVSRGQFQRWRKLGRPNESDEPFRSLSRAVDEAVGQARLRAEMTVFGDQPRIWLQHGPGRETSVSPGWTVAVKPAAKRSGAGDLLMSRVMQPLIRDLMTALTPFPEARAEAAKTLASREGNE